MPGSYVQGQNVDVGTAYSVTVDAAPAPGSIDTFSQADASPWDPWHWDVLTTNASSATQANGRGRLTVGQGGGYGDKVVAASRLAPRLNGGIAFTFIPQDVANEWYLQAVIRAGSRDLTMGDFSAYRIEFNAFGNVELVKRNMGASMSAGTATIAGWGQGVPVRAELFASDLAVGCRVWTGATRPTAATLSFMDIAPLQGTSTGFILNGGNAAGVFSTQQIDDWLGAGPTA